MYPGDLIKRVNFERDAAQSISARWPTNIQILGSVPKTAHMNFRVGDHKSASTL
jgi:hypothetical protein